MYSYERQFVKLCLQKNCKEFNNQRKMIQKKVCFCLAPIRVLQCFCQEATPDKCPSGCPYLDHNLICDIWLYRIKYTAGIIKTGQKAILSKSSFVDLFILIFNFIST